MKKPLEGIKVLDMTRILSGPMCTMILGDMGAEIIKVEPYPEGDDSRGNPPHVNGESMYFVSLNRNKKSIVINLKTDEGNKLLRKLIKECDVLVENFRPGALAKLGFPYETIKGINEKMVYCAISGFGHSGPYSQRAAYDAVIQAMGGIMSVTGPEDGEPVRVGTSIGDATASLFATIGIMSALRVVEDGGPGQFVDISMQDCQVALVEGQLARYFGFGTVPKPLGTRHGTATPFDIFKTKNNSIMIAVQNNNLWKKFTPIMGIENLTEDERFKTNALRCENQKELKAILQEIFLKKTTEEWSELFDKGGIAFGPIYDMEGVTQDPHILSRNMIVEIDGHKKLGKVKSPNTPIKYSETKVGISSPAPVLGQHTDEILKDMGYSDAEITKLRDAKAVE